MTHFEFILFSETTFESVMNLAQERTKQLKDTHRAFQLVREAQELTSWIKTKEQHAQTADVGEDLEQVEMMQKKFDDFQADLKANEARLTEVNEIAMQLVTLGQTEAAIKIQTQLEEVNKKWSELQTTTNERHMAFERAHEVQR